MKSEKLGLSSVKSLAAAPTMESLTLGILMTLTVIGFRAEFHRSIPLLYLESLVLLGLPVIGLAVVIKKLQKDNRPLSQQYWGQVLPVFALGYALVPIFVQPISRRLGCGDAFEVVAITMLMHAAWFLTVFSQFKTFGRVAFMLNGVLVLFICFLSQSYFVFTFAVLFAAISLWWLIGDYWNRVKHKAIDAESTALPVRTWALGSSLVLVLGTAVVASNLGPVREAIALTGFMPASGGTSGDWSDDLARSGIGDGNMLTAGPNARSAGAVDSDQFIEDDKPSMYDINSEKFDGPLKIKKRRNRAIALDVKAKHMEKVIQSEQSGRSFRTLRENSSKELELADRMAKALFFVEGSVPARFTIDHFWHFDGIDWTQGDFGENKLMVPKISLSERTGKPWYSVRSVERDFLTRRRAHRVKIMRLETNALASPAMILSWHIHRMKLENLFRFDEWGKLRASGDLIPTHTMIDMVSQVPNYHRLRKAKNPQLANYPNPMWEWVDTWLGVGSAAGTSVGEYDPRVLDEDILEVQVPDNSTKPKITKLAGDLTEGVRPGWNQVEAIVNHLRNEYKYTPDQVVDPECDDSVGWFLENGGGPSYVFATTATQLLRAAGFRTRLVRGFLVQKSDYDRIARQSIVTSENLHLWPEVCVDGWNWIPVEPTPGFPVPYSHQTIWDWCEAKFMEAVTLIWRNPITFGLLLGFGIFAYRVRMWLVAFLFHGLWRIVMVLNPGARLKFTRRLLDIRFWAAGKPRPKFASLSSWYGQLGSEPTRDFLSHWYRTNFSSREASEKRQLQGEIAEACHRIANTLTLSQIKKTFGLRGDS